MRSLSIGTHRPSISLSVSHLLCSRPYGQRTDSRLGSSSHSRNSQVAVLRQPVPNARSSQKPSNPCSSIRSAYGRTASYPSQDAQMRSRRALRSTP